MKGKLIITASFLSILIFVEPNIFTIVYAEHILNEDNGEYYIVVDKNGRGDYTSIQEAINIALEDSTVYIKIGDYSEIINIKKRVNLVGEDKNKTIINPISEKNKYAIRLGAPEIRISNISVTNGAPGLYTAGIYISTSKTEIKDCNIYNTPIGIAIWTSNNLIDSCSFWGCTDEGIALLGSKYSKCDNNKIINCIFHNNCDGIELQYSSNNVITDCEFYENTHTGIDAIASSNDKNTISNCKIYNNRVHGIYLSSSSDNQIIDCPISNNKDGNIINAKDSHNNSIKNSAYDKELEENPVKQTSTDAGYFYYESNDVISEKDNIINKIINIISKLGLYKTIHQLANF